MIVGISMVRDEADIVAATVGHMIEQCDRVIVADNGSVDGTRDILNNLDCEVIDDPEVGYYQSAKMTRLAHLARERGATWVVPFDADEWWYSSQGRIADVLERVGIEWPVIEAELFDHVPTGLDSDEPDPTVRIGWRRTTPGALPKVACRPTDDMTIGQGNHDVWYGHPVPIICGPLTVRHFPYRTAEQFVRKARNGAQAYAATDLPEDYGRHWREYGRLADDNGPEVLEDVFRKWFWQAEPTGLMFDPAPR